MGDWRKYFRAPFGGWAHPDAPGGGVGSGFSRARRNEHWDAAHVPHPDSPAGKTFDWSALERIDLDDRVRAVVEALDFARKYAPAAIAEATGVEFGVILDGLLPGLMVCLCLVAATTALGAAGGAAIGALAMGIGAAPGAAFGATAGMEAGVALLEGLGSRFLSQRSDRVSAKRVGSHTEPYAKLGTQWTSRAFVGVTLITLGGRLHRPQRL